MIQSRTFKLLGWHLRSFFTADVAGFGINFKAITVFPPLSAFPSASVHKSSEASNSTLGSCCPLALLACRHLWENGATGCWTSLASWWHCWYWPCGWWWCWQLGPQGGPGWKGVAKSDLGLEERWYIMRYPDPDNYMIDLGESVKFFFVAGYLQIGKLSKGLGPQGPQSFSGCYTGVPQSHLEAGGNKDHQPWKIGALTRLSVGDVVWYGWTGWGVDG